MKCTNYHAPCQLCWNDQRLRSGFNFWLTTMWDAPSSVYEISMCVTCVRREAGHWPCHKLEQKADEEALLKRRSLLTHTYMDQHDFVPDELEALMIIR